MHTVAANSRESSTTLKNITAMVLCGGLGTRLRPVVEDRPKSMALVAEKPFLEYQLGWLRDSGIEDVVLCTGHMGEMIRDYFGNGSAFGLSVRYSREQEALGTAGALTYAADFITGNSFFAMNGDSAVEVDLTQLFFEHQSRNAIATLTLVKSDRLERYGEVKLDTEDRVTGFFEKRSGGKRAQIEPGWVNGGVYAFERTIFSKIPSASTAISLETFLFPQLIGSGLYGFGTQGYFIDIGVPEDFARAQEELPRRYGYVHAHTR